MSQRAQAEGTGDSGHETDDAHEEKDDDEMATPAPLQASPQAPSSPPLAAPRPQEAGDMMMNLLKQA